MTQLSCIGKIVNNAVYIRRSMDYGDEERTSYLLEVDSARFPWPAASYAPQMDMDATIHKIMNNNINILKYFKFLT